MADIASVFGRHEFLIRRLHSLTGLVPVGAFLTVHILANMGILDNSYQQRVDMIHSTGERTLEVVEWTCIFLPILFHGIIGTIIVARGQRNLAYYPYPGNLRYTLQRWSGVIAFAFIFWHVFQTRGWINNSEWWMEHVTRPLGGGLFDAKHAVATGVGAVQQAAWVRPSMPSAFWPRSTTLPTACGRWGSPGASGPDPGRNGGPRSAALPSAWPSLGRGCRRCSGSGSITSVKARERHGETIGNDHRRGLGRNGRRHQAGRVGMRRHPDEPPAGQTLAQRLRQGGINSVNDLTRQLGDSEWKHFEDTVYGGDFLQHQPPVKELAYWAPKIIDLMDRLGVTFNRTPEGFRDQRRFGGTLYQRTAFAGATTGQQLVYALDEQVRRWEVTGHIRKYEYWDFLGPVIDETGRCRGAVGQDLVSMEIRAFPADALVIGSGGCGAIYGRSTNSVACNGAAVSRVYQAGGRYGNAEFIQVHPTAIPGADKLRLISESARGEGGRIWVPRKPQDPRQPKDIPEKERYYFLEERYPKYGNLVPRDIGTREIFKVCMQEGLSVQAGACASTST